METNDIKDIWKTGIKENIRSYSDEELNKIVVKSARESIKAIFPGTIFRLVTIGVIVLLIGMLIFREQSKEKMFIDIGALVVLFVSYFIWERSAYKMRKYNNSKPVKEWLEYRIKEVEKSIKFTAKYDWILYGCSLLVAIGFYAFYQIATNIPPSILSLVVISVGIIIYLLIARRSLRRNYQKTIHELKDLYKQFEDENLNE